MRLYGACNPGQENLVSIHAPLAECDFNLFNKTPTMHGFYPRTPRGVRHDQIQINCYINGFYPRTPRGVRPISDFVFGCVWGFYPRTPRGVRPVLQSIADIVVQVSIHAPLAECDIHVFITT